MSNCQKYIFSASSVEDQKQLLELFDKKFREFHDICVEKLTMLGVIELESLINEQHLPSLEEIPMTKINMNPVVCEHIIGGLMENKPVLEYMLVDDFDENDILGMVYHLHGDSVISDDYYVVQHVNNFPAKDRECIQIWKVRSGITSDMMKKIWS